MNQAETKRRQAEALSDILMLITIPVIGRMTGDNGITYVAVAVEIYALLWTAVSGNLSDTLGRLIRSRKNKRQYRNVVNMRRNAMLFQAALGLLGSLLLLLFAGKIAGGLFKIPYGEFIIMLLSPVVLLRSVTSVLLGYFQGEGSELPRSVAGILRQILILGLGVLFSGMLGDYGEKVSALLREDNFTAMYGGMGIAIAVSLAEALILIFLVLLYAGSRRLEKNVRQEGMYSTESFADCVSSLYANRWPLLLTEVMEVLPLALGLLFWGRAAEAEDVLALEYSGYAGGYLVACGVAVSLISLVVLPVISRTFAGFRQEESRYARTMFQSGVHMCLVHGIFLSVFVAVMGGQIAGFLCPDNGETVQKMLQGGSSVILFTVLSCFFGRFLQNAGGKYFLLGAVSAADVVFAVTVLIIPGIGKAGILSLVYGGITGLFMLCILLGVFVYRKMRMRVDWLGIMIVPLGAGGVSGLICLLLGKALSPHFGSLLVLSVTFVAAAAVYWILLLLLRNIREQELEVIPGGRLISILGQMLRVY